MGFFGKLFEKKVCSICGGEIGLLGNRKLEDGNCCKVCAGKLSYWFDDRRHSTVDQIKEQLAYREENRKKLESFRPIKHYGEEYSLKVELENGVPKRFVVARTDDYREENADLIDFSQVTSFQIDIDEDETEQKYENKDGDMVSYKPPRYEYSYDFYAQIHTDCPYCDDIRFRLNESSLVLESVQSGARFGASQFTPGIRGFKPQLYPQYREYKALCDEVEQVFQAGMQGTPLPGYAPAPEAAPVVRSAPAAAAEPGPVSGPKFCTSCGAAADGGKFCQFCGSPL